MRVARLREKEREYIHNIFDFTDATAKEIMIPRIDMTMVNVNWSYDKLVETFKEDMFTRLPVYEGDTDNIIGLINMKDMILARAERIFPSVIICEKYILPMNRRIPRNCLRRCERSA